MEAGVVMRYMARVVAEDADVVAAVCELGGEPDGEALGASVGGVEMFDDKRDLHCRFPQGEMCSLYRVCLRRAIFIRKYLEILYEAY